MIFSIEIVQLTFHYFTYLGSLFLRFPSFFPFKWILRGAFPLSRLRIDRGCWMLYKLQSPLRQM